MINNQPVQSNHIKTSGDILSQFNQQRYGNSELKPPTVQISHQARGNSVLASNNNLSNYDMYTQPASNNNNNIYYSQQQPYLSTPAQSNVQKQLFSSSMVTPQDNRPNRQSIYPQDQLANNNYQKSFTQSNNYLPPAQSGVRESVGNAQYDNMNQIGSKIEEHQRLSDKKNNNKLYDSFIGKERDFGSPSQQNLDEKVKKSQKFNQNGPNFGSQQSSKEIGLSLIQQEQKRYFGSGPEQLTNVMTLQRNRGTYKGQVKQIRNETILEGIGQFEMNNGDFYMGQFWRNYMHGDGYLLKANGDFYSGKFQNDKLQGFGRYFYFNKDYYEGNFYNFQRQSDIAKFYSSAEDAIYEIPFDQDKKHGKGQKKDSLGNVSNVEYFKDVQQTEEEINRSKLQNNDYLVSKIKDEDFEELKVKRAHKPQQDKPDIPALAQKELEEFIKEGLPLHYYDQPVLTPIQGLAIYKFEDGSYFAGNWENGNYNGFGHYYDSKIGLYKGNFVNGTKSGFGDMLYINGDQYSGNWLVDKKHDEVAVYFKYSKGQRNQVCFLNGALLKVMEQVQ